MMASTATGMFTGRCEPHQKCSSSQPPMIGPSGDPDARHGRPDPDRLARVAGSVKTLVISPRVVGKIIAAPTPITARAAISVSAEFSLCRNPGCDGE